MPLSSGKQKIRKSCEKTDTYGYLCFACHIAGLISGSTRNRQFPVKLRNRPKLQAFF